MGFNLDEYESVEVRLQKFWDKYPNGRVDTSIVLDNDAGWVIGSAAVYRNVADHQPFATGFAHAPIRGGKQAEGTHPLETCETSAIGRALANGDFGARDKKRPSREEMADYTPPVEAVNIGFVLESMDQAQKESFKALLKLNYPGISITNLHPDLVDGVVGIANDVLGSSVLSKDFGEEPF